MKILSSLVISNLYFLSSAEHNILKNASYQTLAICVGFMSIQEVDNRIKFLGEISF